MALCPAHLASIMASELDHVVALICHFPSEGMKELAFVMHKGCVLESVLNALCRLFSSILGNSLEK